MNEELNKNLLILAKLCSDEMDRRRRVTIWKSVFLGMALAGVILTFIWKFA